MTYISIRDLICFEPGVSEPDSKEELKVKETYEVCVYSTREYHHDEIDYTFYVRVEASSVDEAIAIVEEECQDSGCNERCEIQGASEGS